MSKRGDIFIVGTGGHAREVAEMALALDFHPVLVARTELDAAGAIGWDVIVESEWDPKDHAVAIAIGEPAVRQSVFRRMTSLSRFPSLIHPDASVGPSLRPHLAEAVGLQVLAGARLTTNIRAGRFVVINQNATVAHDCVLGDFVTIAPGANVSGAVELGDGVWVGTGAAINQGESGSYRRIGQGAVIGSGAVVVRDCDAQGVYVGVPAKRIA